MTGEKLLRTAADAIFAKDKAQGPNHPDGYSIPATQYFTNKCAAAANKSPSEGAQRGAFHFDIRCYLPICRSIAQSRKSTFSSGVAQEVQKRMTEQSPSEGAMKSKAKSARSASTMLFGRIGKI